jgi:DNA replication protein DnaC
MGKKIGLKQLAQKTYRDVDGLPDEFKRSFGEIEDAFDCIIYGNSGNGKTNFTVQILKHLIKALKQKAIYISYEEGHTKTIQKTMIERHNMLNEVGNLLELLDHSSFDELVTRMNKRKSAKIWVIDSLQASHFTEEQCAMLKEKFIMSRKKKIIIYISWADGKLPKGAAAKAVEFYAHIKIRVEGLIAFFKSRFGGNKNYVIWEEGAKRYWGLKSYNKHRTR